MSEPATDLSLRCSRPANLMEVCGTHSHALARYGIKQLLPSGVRMLSGPGCPVCVTPTRDIDLLVALARHEGVTLCTFGDMMRVPGTRSSLSLERAIGADVRVVYSPMEAVEYASADQARQVVFAGVGFETTAPMVAVSVLAAAEAGLTNYSVLSAHKTVPPALSALMEADDVRIDGFLCPGHVSAVIGMHPYEAIAARYRVPCVVAGFEATDLLLGLQMLLDQIDAGKACAENAYERSVRPEGNLHAQTVMAEVFEPCDSEWRGLGRIPDSGLRLRSKYACFDASVRCPMVVEASQDPPGCRCGEVLRGALLPEECPLFASDCTPAAPVGPCMVSTEGACAAAYRYGDPTEVQVPAEAHNV
ncbi:hydrogenase formation protein HypD [bacterium]|nr:hydrogenase formation protein HypD [bacterium]